MARKYLIETFGCQMNVHDSERMAGLLEQAGYEPTADDRDADVIVINTCSVRERAEEKLYTRLGELRMLGDGDRAAPDRRGRRLRRAAGRRRSSCKRSTARVDVIVGTQNSEAAADARARRAARQVDAVAGRRPRPAATTCRFRWASRAAAIPFKAYVTIIEGCNEFCAFCVVPVHARPRADAPGGATSSPRRAHAVDTGAREVQLLGQIVNHYQAPDDPACDFAELLARLNDDRRASSGSASRARIRAT